MQHLNWNTADVRARDRFDYYRSGLCAAFAHLTPRPDAISAQFRADLDLWSEGPLAITSLQTESHAVDRSAADLSAAEDQHIYLNYMVRGTMELSQGNQVARLSAGDMVLIDNARPFSARLDSPRGHRHLAVRLPREAVEAWGTPGRAIDGGALAPLLRAHLQNLARATADNRPALIRPGLACIETLCRAWPDDSLSDAARATLIAVREHIARCYRDPELSLATTAAALHRPPRTLQAHLRLAGVSFSVLLRDHRLARAEEALEAASRHESIEHLAEAQGFADLSSFYRSFRRRHGRPPGAWRAARRGDHQSDETD